MSLLERLRDYLMPAQPCPVCAETMVFGDDGRQWCPDCGYVPCACDGD